MADGEWVSLVVWSARGLVCRAVETAIAMSTLSKTAIKRKEGRRDAIDAMRWDTGPRSANAEENDTRGRAEEATALIER